MGRPHGREDGAGLGGRAGRAGPDRLARRLRRRPPHRSGAAVPGPPRRRPHLLQPGQAVRPGPPDLLPVRPVGGRRGLHPVVLRRRVHGRRQRLDVPRLAAHGRDGRRRDHDARGDGRGPDARLAVGVRRQPRRRRRGRHRAGPGLPLVLPAHVARRAADLRVRAARGRAHGRHRAGRRAGAVRHARRHRRHRRPPQLLRGQAAVRPRADRRPGPPRRPAGRHRRQQLGPPRRHAVRRLGRQGGPVHLVLRRLQHPARVPGRRARGS